MIHLKKNRKTYFVSIDKKTCNPSLVSSIEEADYVFDANSEKEALNTAFRCAVQEKCDGIGIFDNFSDICE